MKKFEIQLVLFKTGTIFSGQRIKKKSLKENQFVVRNSAYKIRLKAYF